MGIGTLPAGPTLYTSPSSVSLSVQRVFGGGGRGHPSLTHAALKCGFVGALALAPCLLHLGGRGLLHAPSPLPAAYLVRRRIRAEPDIAINSKDLSGINPLGFQVAHRQGRRDRVDSPRP